MWRWERTHLLLPGGLFAYHWRAGRVDAVQPASDGDLDSAWALVLGGTRFHEPAERAAGLQIAAAVLDQETSVVAGRLELVAGPWARQVPAVVDPSYLAPEAMTALARASGDPRWTALAADTAALATGLSTGTPARLPPDWLWVGPGGGLHPVGSPSGSGRPRYGLDAQRAVVWQAASCADPERSSAARDWRVLGRAADRGARLAYTLTGRAASPKVNPLGLVAAAAAAEAAGQPAVSRSLLAAADRQAARAPTYYGDAWVALGRVLLDTPWLSRCGGAAA